MQPSFTVQAEPLGNAEVHLCKAVLFVFDAEIWSPQGRQLVGEDWCKVKEIKIRLEPTNKRMEPSLQE